jgi:hypothetical protein
MTDEQDKQPAPSPELTEKAAKAFADGADGAEEQQAKLPEGVTPEVFAAATAMERKVGPVVRQVLGIVIRGLLVSSPGVPPNVLLGIMAWQTGNLLAGAFQADLGTTLMVRKQLKEGFAEGIAKTPVAQPPMQGGMMPAKLNG